MATIGVTRGLGDHDLKVYNSNIYIKPFLSCVPEVSVSGCQCQHVFKSHTLSDVNILAFLCFVFSNFNQKGLFCKVKYAIKLSQHYIKNIHFTQSILLHYFLYHPVFS